MLIKIADMFLKIVDTFREEIPQDTPWEMFLKGDQGLAYDLTQMPNYSQILGYYVRCQFLPASYMQTFEEMFHTGFIEGHSHIFKPSISQLNLRYIAFKSAQEQNPVHARIKEAEDKERKLQHERAAAARRHLQASRGSSSTN